MENQKNLVKDLYLPTGSRNVAAKVSLEELAKADVESPNFDDSVMKGTSIYGRPCRVVLEDEDIKKLRATIELYNNREIPQVQFPIDICFKNTAYQFDLVPHKEEDDSMYLPASTYHNLRLIKCNSDFVGIEVPIPEEIREKYNLNSEKIYVAYQFHRGTYDWIKNKE